MIENAQFGGILIFGFLFTWRGWSYSDARMYTSDHSRSAHSALKQIFENPIQPATQSGVMAAMDSNPALFRTFR